MPRRLYRDRADSPWWQLAYDRMLGNYDDVRTICPAPKVVYPLTSDYDSDSGCSDTGDQCGWNIFYCPLCGDAVDTRPITPPDTGRSGGSNGGSGGGGWYLPIPSVIKESREPPRVIPQPVVKPQEILHLVSPLESAPGTGPGLPVRSGRIMSGISRIVKHFHRVLAQLAEERFVWLFLSLVLHAMVYTMALVTYSTVYRRNRSHTNTVSVSTSVTPMVTESGLNQPSDTTSGRDEDKQAKFDNDPDEEHVSCDPNACLQHANDLEEMAKAVEYLHKVNAKNEREIHNKAESISLLERTIHELYRQYQDLQRHMKEDGVEHTQVPEPLLKSTSKDATGSNNDAVVSDVVDTSKEVKATEDKKSVDKASKKSKSGKKSTEKVSEKKSEKKSKKHH